MEYEGNDCTNPCLDMVCTEGIPILLCFKRVRTVRKKVYAMLCNGIRIIMIQMSFVILLFPNTHAHILSVSLLP